MSLQVPSIGEAISPPPPLILPPIGEAGFGYKILATLPFFGSLAQVIIENRLKKAAETVQKASPDLNRFVKLVELKNQYKICGIIRSVLEIAAIVTFLALGIITALNALPALVLLAAIGAFAYNIYRNNKMLTDVRTQGLGNQNVV